MKLKMLNGIAGSDFSLAPGEETDRFSDKEARRLIAEGHAEKAPFVEPKKPATKAEWDVERDAMLSELTGLRQDLEVSRQREVELGEQVADLAAFKSGVVAVVGPTLEIAVAAPAPEKRG